MLKAMGDRYDVAVVGAGIVGLAHATLLAQEGLKVVVVERGHRALGASVRNFGMIWPIGQPPGEMREMALRSRETWLDVLAAAGIWHARVGSLHLAYHEDELAVLTEFVGRHPEYGARIVGPSETLQRSPVVRPDGLLGAMWSPQELCVDPREVVSRLPDYLRSLGVEFRFAAAASHVETGILLAGGERIQADHILLSTGDDLETLFPARFAAMGLVRTKLQMLRARPRRADYRIGAHLCAGLTLGHYANFRDCATLEPLLERFARELPEHVWWGVHLLVSQHENGDLTIGDSHEYGPSPDPFLRESIDRLILDYLNTFLPLEDFEVVERWQGVYAKHPHKGYVVEELAKGVTAATGVGGAGMTLSFGLARTAIERSFLPNKPTRPGTIA